MILLLDLGNTRIKWMLTNSLAADNVIDKNESDKKVHRGTMCFERFFIQAADNILSQSVCDKSNGCIESSAKNINNGIEAIFVSPVADAKLNQKIIRWCFDCGLPRPHLIEVKKHFAGVTAAYDNLHNLGVDRWLALLATSMIGVEKGVKKSCRDAVVMDLGSAITIDVLRASGVHAGGVIIPGMGMMQASLGKILGERAGKFSTDFNADKFQLGRDTSECVDAGLFLVLSGVFLSLYGHIRQFEISNDYDLYLTGGDSALVEELARVLGKKIINEFSLASNFVYPKCIIKNDDLVFDGMMRYVCEWMSR